MIPLVLPVSSEGDNPFICRVRNSSCHTTDSADVDVLGRSENEWVLTGSNGMFCIELHGIECLEGDVLLVDPQAGRAERLFRNGSKHNTLLVTERCDQLCVMCSQPPKKTHLDRFKYFEEACLLCEENSLIGISGGEPTLYKQELFNLIENTVALRPDVGFHVLSNGQHFTHEDIARLQSPSYRNVIWGIPLYASSAALHDEIVGKIGAFDRLKQSFARLMRAGARVELRTVLLASNILILPDLANFISRQLGFIESWSIMQLENIGFAKNRWHHLYVDHQLQFSSIAEAIDQAQMRRVAIRLFNFPRCTVPGNYRHLAPASISDWKRKFPNECALCSQQAECSGFFEWHPVSAMKVKAI